MCNRAPKHESTMPIFKVWVWVDLSGSRAGLGEVDILDCTYLAVMSWTCHVSFEPSPGKWRLPATPQRKSEQCPPDLNSPRLPQNLTHHLFLTPLPPRLVLPQSEFGGCWFPWRTFGICIIAQRGLSFPDLKLPNAMRKCKKHSQETIAIALLCWRVKRLHAKSLDNRMSYTWFSGNKTHKQKQIRGIVPGLGGWQKLVYVIFGVIPYGGEKHINKIPRESWIFLRRFCLCVFSSVASLLPRFSMISWGGRSAGRRCLVPKANGVLVSPKWLQSQILDTQIGSAFKSNLLALWNRSESNHCDFGGNVYPLSTDSEAILVANISLAPCNFKSLWFEIAALPICDLLGSEKRGLFRKIHLLEKSRDSRDFGEPPDWKIKESPTIF